jgi:hypothetical protein
VRDQVSHIDVYSEGVSFETILRHEIFEIRAFVFWLRSSGQISGQ